jgi:hypothetical protein
MSVQQVGTPYSRLTTKALTFQNRKFFEFEFNLKIAH